MLDFLGLAPDGAGETTGFGAIGCPSELLNLAVMGKQVK